MHPHAHRCRIPVILGAFAAVAALPAAAEAAVVDLQGSTLVYTAGAGERNSLRVVSQGTNVVNLLEQTSSRVQSRTPLCVKTGPPGDTERAVRCSLIGITGLDVRLGDGGDSFGAFHPIAARVDGGSGDDSYAGISPRLGPLFDSPRGISQVTFNGGSGRDEASYQLITGSEGVIVSKDGLANDGGRGDRDNVQPDVEVLRGSGQGDVLSGSANADIFHSTGGDDLLLGNNGDDLFLMGAIKDGPTRVIGGPERDTVTYAGRERRITVSADNETSTDGESGEGDRIEGAEVIEGGEVSDAIFTPATTELGYRLIGGDGDDLLSSAAGRDRLIGGRGEDTMASGPDRDVIEALDSEEDGRIDCGSGGPDEVFGDFREGPISGCEIRRFPQLGVGTLDLTSVARPRADGSARVTLSWQHPRAWQKLRAITVRVRDGDREVGRLTIRPRAGRVASGRGGVRLARGSRVTRRGRKVSARLELRLPTVRGGALAAEITATETTGRRQTELRLIAITEEATR